MSRPTLPTVKRLFAVSGNLCAFPGCTLPLIDEPSGKVTGRICHIKAQNIGGPRYDLNQSEEERHAFENLLLLCPIHHDVIDSNSAVYTVEKLLLIKSAHESANHSRHELGDEAAGSLINNIPEGSLLLTQNQSGGQVAHQINNYLLPPEVSGTFERERQFQLSFLPASDVLIGLITRNFLFEFNGVDSDYTNLLSKNFRLLFFHFFNQHLRTGKINRIVISGHEGSGKTFNTLLLSLQLSREKYNVYYCQDIRTRSLTPSYLRALADQYDNYTIFIIDNVQLDLIKMENFTTSISRFGSYEKTPIFIFLTRPLEQNTLIETFGVKTPVLKMKEKLIDFERLVSLFFQSRGRPNDAKQILREKDTLYHSGDIIKYRNMAFWNEVLRSITEGTTQSLTEKHIFIRAHSFFKRRESHLLTFHRDLERLLPLFNKGLVVPIDYAYRLLGDRASETLSELERLEVIRRVEQDWESDQYGGTYIFAVASQMHVTKSKLLSQIIRKFYGSTVSPIESITEYAEHFLDNLHYILGAYTDPIELRLLFKDAKIISLTQRYLSKRHLGKKLYHVILRLADLDLETKNSLFNEQVLDAIAGKINAEGAFLVSKINTIRGLHKTYPEMALELFNRLRADAISATFLYEKPTMVSMRSDVYYLSKAMEVLKNLYLFSPSLEQKEAVQSYVRHTIDQCRSEFISRLTRVDPYITQLHWMVKRLGRIELGGYFLEGIAPNSLAELIRTKNTNVVELSEILRTARYARCEGPDGSSQEYYEVLKEMLSYDDLKRIFDNRRSDLFDLGLRIRHDFVARALVKYSDDPNFKLKVAAESLESRKKSLQVFSTGSLLSKDEKEKIVDIIKSA